MPASQYMPALERANEIRLTRARVRLEIFGMPRREGIRAVAAIIRDPGELWASAPLDRVLRMPERCGPRYSTRIRRNDFRPDKRLDSLTDRQRELLCVRMGVGA